MMHTNVYVKLNIWENIFRLILIEDSVNIFSYFLCLNHDTYYEIISYEPGQCMY